MYPTQMGFGLGYRELYETNFNDTGVSINRVYSKRKYLLEFDLIHVLRFHISRLFYQYNYDNDIRYLRIPYNTV